MALTFKIKEVEPGRVQLLAYSEGTLVETLAPATLLRGGNSSKVVVSVEVEADVDGPIIL